MNTDVVVKAILFLDATTICNMCNLDVVTHVTPICNMCKMAIHVLHLLPHSVTYVINMCYICQSLWCQFKLSKITYVTTLHHPKCHISKQTSNISKITYVTYVYIHGVTCLT